MSQPKITLANVFQPGSCSVMFSNLMKSLKLFRPFLELPVNFPAGAAYGSAELKSWVEEKSFRNWYRIPQYCKWMREQNDQFQTHVAFKGKTQQIIARMLDIILFETNPPVTVAGESKPMGLSNLGSVAGSVFQKGRVLDNNGVVLASTKTPPDAFANITFSNSKDTFFMTPFEDQLPNSTERALCFPVLIMPGADNNEGGDGTQFLYFTFEFGYKIFDSQPTPTASKYTLRANQYHNLVPLITSIQSDLSLSDHDKAEVFQGVLEMLRKALNGTTMGSLELKYNRVIKNWISAKLMPPSAATKLTYTNTATPAAQTYWNVGPAGAPYSSTSPTTTNPPGDVAVTTPTQERPLFPEVGNQPFLLTNDQFDLTTVSGQTPVYNWTPLLGINGYGLQVQLINAYFGYPPKFTSTNLPSPADATAKLGWYTAQPGADLAPVKIYDAAGVEVGKATPVVYSSISDFIQFSVDESASTAVLTVSDRQFVLQKGENDTPMMYPLYLTRTLSTLFRTKGLLWDQSRGMSGNLTLGNLSSLSGINTPIVQALILAYADSVAQSCIPVYAGATKPAFTYFSPLFTNARSSTVSDLFYFSSVRDILAYWMNVQPSTLQTAIGPNSIALSDPASIRIVRTTGDFEVDTMVTPNKLVPHNAKHVFTDYSELMREDVFGVGLNLNMGVAQASDLKISMNSFSATAGAHGSGLTATPVQTASATYQPANGQAPYEGGPTITNPYTVSRLAQVAAANGSKSVVNKGVARPVATGKNSTARTVVARSAQMRS